MNKSQLNKAVKKTSSKSKLPKKGRLPDPTGAPSVPRRSRLLNAAPKVAAQARMAALRPSTYFRSAEPLRKGSSVRFQGCDYINVLTTSTTTPDVYHQPIEPGNSAVFPRLVSLSLIFGKYNFNRLRFSIVGDAPSTLGGAITLAPVYESNGTSAAMSIVDARNREQQETRKFWEDFSMDFDCGKATVPWFVMPGEAGTSDPTTYYFGEIHAVADTTAAATPVSQLFVEYDVEFCEAIAIGDAALAGLSKARKSVEAPALQSSAVSPLANGNVVRVDPTSGRISFERPRA